ncbi:hypothetical protein GF373_02880 [bacterium]|nr:hypothetical protein [bacterium]
MDALWEFLKDKSVAILCGVLLSLTLLIGELKAQKESEKFRFAKQWIQGAILGIALCLLLDWFF